ncbi:fibronectin type III domain-containing protein [Rugamonas rubra]|uniref:Fibronectin type III domain-containing protein n=1 Tax=Rugamonas rubra TaxID=758825 RepID=A0A1I4MRS1_9BURK|nr:fibronectin type III domain-containing protein [Rugamonas rubra]SFM06021.1 Fibronectin type III domain-containing protein [Rugamonas rubra]
MKRTPWLPELAAGLLLATLAVAAQAQSPVFNADNKLVPSPEYPDRGDDLLSYEPNLAFRLGRPTFGAGLSTVPTYQSISVYWAPPDGAEGNTATVHYRAQGQQEWKEGLALWFDPRNKEYRGSLTMLKAGTSYEVQVQLQSGTTESKNETTWSDNYPIGETRIMKGGVKTLELVDSGRPDAYVLYVPEPGSQIDMGVPNLLMGNGNNCITVKASYVIVRGFTLKNCQRQGIAIMAPSHDVVIEENDISGFGGGILNSNQEAPIAGPTNKIVTGREYDAGIYCYSYVNALDQRASRITIQRNRIYEPRYGSQDWGPAPVTHPNSAQAIMFGKCGTNNVIRYNEIRSVAGHYFNDGIGGESNFTFEGFPFADSDIYGNNISGVYDDAIESEGGNRNVRIWGNYLHRTYMGIAMAAVAQGPLYVFRNVLGDTVGMANPNAANQDTASHGNFFKIGSKTEKVNGGRIYLFHNTNLQPRPPAGTGLTYNVGTGGAIGMAGGATCNVVSRNNVISAATKWWTVVQLNEECGKNDIDYDVYWGRLIDGVEAHGTYAEPIFNATLDPVLVRADLHDATGPRTSGQVFKATVDVAAIGDFTLRAGSLGRGKAQRLPNFNDEYATPDAGAHQSGTGKMEFGVDAYRTPKP